MRSLTVGGVSAAVDTGFTFGRACTDAGKARQLRGVGQKRKVRLRLHIPTLGARQQEVRISRRGGLHVLYCGRAHISADGRTPLHREASS